nr:PAS domain S-box protein [Flammeovirgaceae bacterium]
MEEKKKNYFFPSSKYNLVNFSYLNQIKDILFETDAEGNLIAINEAWVNITGIEQGKLKNKPVYELFTEDIRDSFLIDFRRLLKGELSSFSLDCKLNSDTPLSSSFICNLSRVTSDKGKLIGTSGRISEILQPIPLSKNGENGNNLFKNVFETISDIYIHLDKDEIIQLVSPSVKEVLQFSPEELIGKKASEIIILPENKIEVVKILEEYKAAENFETYLKTKDGNKKFVSMNLNILKDSENNFLGINGIIRDITEKQDRKLALKESEERYRKLSSLTFEGIVIHHNGVVLDMNARFSEMMGYEKEEAIGQNIIEMMIPEKWHPLVNQNISLEYTLPYEIEGIKKDGHIFPVEIQSRNIHYKGQWVRVVAVKDITNRKKAEFQIRKTELKYQKLFDSSSEGIVICDMDGNITEVN